VRGMTERTRLAVALLLPALVVIAMFFAPLDDVARGSQEARMPGFLESLLSRGSEGSGGRANATAAPAGQEASYDWADILQLDGIRYSAGLLNAGRALRQEDLGGEVARVSAKLNGNVQPSRYEPKDGDAAYLQPGTPVYSVNGYLQTFRLAAPRGAGFALFEVLINPKAHAARELLDIDGKVKSVSVNTTDPRATGRVIDRPEDVAAIVAMILNARVEPVPFSKRTAYVSLRLLDGTAVTFQFAAETGSLSRGIVGLPREFASLVAP
jgi:hypothetical protein